MKSHHKLGLISVVALGLVAATAQADQRTPQSSLVLLEVIDAGAQQKQTVRLSVPIVDTAPARVETHAGGSAYKVSLHRSRGSTDRLHLELDRRELERRGRESADLELDLQLLLPKGKRVVVTELRRPSGTTTRVYASAR